MSILVSLKDILLHGAVLAEEVLVVVPTGEGLGVVLAEDVLIVVLTLKVIVALSSLAYKSVVAGPWG